ncbi:ANTAR domain-containing protein [Modestobacter italicus]|uniref:ANTAR domain-containing protein n=1 Tax=Modestobacter italicus (strain DSM 44449 / CECT 9708 / BC 501) TaxID=2732864 RepID=UPI0002E9EA41|nr:ANTAR domain-containing protein [Modestobacter marinus]
MTLIVDFHDALTAAGADLPGVELLPERLAHACAQVLPVDGAGIGLFFSGGRRLPLGASDPVSGEAERLQFTLGDGPCLSSHASGETVVADEPTLRSRWPAFHDALLARTTVRGTVSLPLGGRLRSIGALDLYLVPPHAVAGVSLLDARVVAAEVAAALLAGGRGGEQPDGPAWLDTPAAGRRSRVWQAMGFVNSGLGLSSPDALALLRAHAYAEGSSLDELAVRVVGHEVRVDELSPDLGTR